MNKAITISIILLSVIKLNAQISYYVGGHLSPSMIPNSKLAIQTAKESDKPNYNLFKSEGYMAQYTNGIGFDVFVGANYFIQENLSFDSELLLNNSNYTQQLSVKTQYLYQDISNGKYEEVKDLTNTESTTDNFNVGFINLPLGVSYYLLDDHNLAVGLGLSPSLLLFAKNKGIQSTELNRLAMGMYLNLRYEVKRDIWLTINFQENSTKLYKTELKQSFSNLRMLKLGLKYYL